MGKYTKHIVYLMREKSSLNVHSFKPTQICLHIKVVDKLNLYIDNYIEHEHGEVYFGVCGHHVYICKYICPSLSSVTIYKFNIIEL